MGRHAGPECGELESLRIEQEQLNKLWDDT